MSEKKGIHWSLEIAKFGYVTVVSLVLFLFFCLMLDMFCWLFFGGWDPLLGKWPIFSGTMSAAFYAPFGSVLSLLIGLGIMARVMLGEKTPTVLEFMLKSESGQEDDALKESAN
ncbi:MAG: hypothetical protein AAF570_10350 [Bacteroidota bacterium]